MAVSPGILLLQGHKKLCGCTKNNNVGPETVSEPETSDARGVQMSMVTPHGCHDKMFLYTVRYFVLFVLNYIASV